MEQSLAPAARYSLSSLSCLKMADVVDESPYTFLRRCISSIVECSLQATIGPNAHRLSPIRHGGYCQRLKGEYLKLLSVDF